MMKDISAERTHRNTTVQVLVSQADNFCEFAVQHTTCEAIQSAETLRDTHTTRIRNTKTITCVYVCNLGRVIVIMQGPVAKSFYPAPFGVRYTRVTWC